MNETKKGCYKYCVVPNCVSTTIKTPDKIFFHVPLDKERRKKWCRAMKRDLIAPKSIKYVCEDHFDLENDTENLVKYKLVGGTLKLKLEVCPHNFDCQKKPPPKRESRKKRRRLGLFENLFKKKDIPSHSSAHPIEMIVCDSVVTSEQDEPNESADDQINKRRHKGIQVNIRVNTQDEEVQTMKRRNKARIRKKDLPVQTHSMPKFEFVKIETDS